MLFKTTGQKGQFKSDSGFTVDFRPFIAKAYYFETDTLRNIQIKKYLYNFEGYYVLEHWNNLNRTIGLWDSTTNNYITPILPSVRQPISNTSGFRCEYFSEKKSVRPTYCIVHLNKILVKEKNLWMLKEKKE